MGFFFLDFLEYSKYYAYLCATFDILIVLLELNGIWRKLLEALVKAITHRGSWEMAIQA